MWFVSTIGIGLSRVALLAKHAATVYNRNPYILGPIRICCYHRDPDHFSFKFKQPNSASPSGSFATPKPYNVTARSVNIPFSIRSKRPQNSGGMELKSRTYFLGVAECTLTLLRIFLALLINDSVNEWKLKLCSWNFNYITNFKFRPSVFPFSYYQLCQIKPSVGPWHWKGLTWAKHFHNIGSNW